MTNHPHDCPVCEEGGHCHLQDMTVMTGHNSRRYRFTKRTHQNQDLGPFINHEMNRCIACYRCVRYYKDYAGGSDLGVYGAHDNVYFGRVEDGVLESEFSGNLTEVCPTGVFTDKTHSERYNRKWDMQFAPSVCQQCAVGCNISPGERYGELRRIENRFNGAVNHYFLCDRGRFGYGYVNRADRPRQPLRAGIRVRGWPSTPAWTQAPPKRCAACAPHRHRLAARQPGSNFALRELVGADNFSVGMAAAEWHCRAQDPRRACARRGRTPSLREMEERDAVLVLGEDVTQTAPRIALALRQAYKGKAARWPRPRRSTPGRPRRSQHRSAGERHPLFIASVDATPARRRCQRTAARHARTLAQLGFAVAHAARPEAPAVALGSGSSNGPQADRQRAAGAKRPLIVSGTGLRCEALIDAVRQHRRAHCAGRGSNQRHDAGAARGQQLGVAMLGGGDVEPRWPPDGCQPCCRARERSLPARRCRAGRCGAGACSAAWW
jgi:NADH-quinone oxidoreductase subunit G